MKGFVNIIDNNWCAFLAQQPGIDEVNLAARRERGGDTAS